MAKLFILAVISLFGVRFSHGQLLAGIEDCTSPEFLLNVTSCFADKFLSLLPNSFEDEEHVYTGRRLQGFGDGTSHDGAMRETILNDISKGFISDHKDFMENLNMAIQLLAQREKEAIILDKLHQANFKDLLDNWLDSVMSQVSNLAMGKVHSMAHLFGDRSSYVDIPDVVCTVALNNIFGEQFCPCMAEFHEVDFEDSVKWLKCFFNCDDLPAIGACVDEKFDECDPTGKWSFASSIVNKGFAQFAELDTCLLKVEVPMSGGIVPTPEDPIELTEGGDIKMVKVSTYMSPGALCTDLSVLSGGILGSIRDAIGVLRGNTPNCEVTIEMSTANYIHNIIPDMTVKAIFPPLDIATGRPQCLGGGAVQQVMIGPHEYQGDEGACVLPVTKDNWLETHHIPIAAAIDYMQDGEVATNLTFKLRVQGRTQYNYKHNVTVSDTDPAQSSMCSIVNDPHITTFDGHYYNNHYEGYFKLYESTDQDNQPYEVQAIFQKCDGTDATCTCAVAVRSGDDVFVMDRCRKIASTCSGESCQLLKAIMYLNGELSPGTRLYRQHEGQRFDVLLPHGLHVRIENNMNMLNVWITPSNYDTDITQGLCGVFDEDVTNDLMLPNGTVYTGEGSNMRGQPRPFSQAWRVPEGESIFRGALEESMPVADMNYCGCNHILLRGVRCHCGGLADPCNFRLDGEITSNVSMIARRSRTQIEALHGVTLDITTDDIDIDEDYNPPEFDWGAWNQTDATAFCADLLYSSDNVIIQQCIDSFGEAFLDTVMYQCEEDILMSESTDYQYSALQAAKVKCWGEKARTRDTLALTLVDLPNIGDIIASRRPAVYENSTCLNECNGKGICVEGMCQCDSAAVTGADCSLPGNNKPQIIMDSSNVCDTRYEDCQWATIYGAYFRDDDSLMCHVREVEMMGDGSFKDKGGESPVSAIFLSSNQIACHLPQSGSYRVALYYEAERVPMAANQEAIMSNDDTFVFMAADSVCYTCDISTQSCMLREGTDYCFIDNSCNAPGQMKPNDTCLYCNNTQTTQHWTWKSDMDCTARKEAEDDEREQEKRNQNIRIAVACSLSALIVLVTIVLFFLSKKNVAGEKEMELTTPVSADDEKKGKSHKVDISAEPEHVYDNPTMIASDETPPSPMTPRSYADDVFVHDKPQTGTPEVIRAKKAAAARGRTRYESDGGNSVKDLLRAKQLARESRMSRERTESMGSASVASIGIGGGGGGPPVHYSAHDTDAGLGGRGSPQVQTKTMYDGIFVNTMF